MHSGSQCDYNFFLNKDLKFRYDLYCLLLIARHTTKWQSPFTIVCLVGTTYFVLFIYTLFCSRKEIVR